MNKNHMIGIAVLIILVGAGAFWGGMTYGKNQAATTASTGGGRNFGGGGGRGGRFANGGGAFGSVIAKDATSITVQITNASSSMNSSGTGSKIVLYDTSTQVGKFVVGAASDLSIGENVAVSGTPNPDGSITAQSIQIRPAGERFPARGN